MDALSPSTLAVLYMIAGMALALGGVVPGWYAFRRSVNRDGLPVAVLERDRYKMAARIYELESEVGALREKLQSFDSMVANIDRLTAENLSLHRRVDTLTTEVEGLYRENQKLRGGTR